MITLYHCDAARSFRPLWMLEELGLPYELKMLPFPPRVFAKDYLALNPLGTIPFMIDGETRMTESTGICHYLGTKYGPTPLVVGTDEPAYGAFLNWMYFSLSPRSGATRRSRPTMPNGSSDACGSSRPQPPVPKRYAPAASPPPTSRSAMRSGWPTILGFPRILGPM